MITLIALAVLIVAAAFWYSYSYNKKKNVAVANWSSTTGIITVASIVRESQRDADSDISISYTPHVNYSYEALGQKLTGKRIAYKNMISTTQKYAQTAIDAYPVGKTVTVYYDPRNPSDSVLERQA